MDNERAQSIDPNLSKLLSGMNHQTEQRRQPLKIRQKKAKEQKRQQARNRVTLDLPVMLEAHLNAQAAEYDVSVSQMAALLIWSGLQDISDGRLDPGEYRKRSKTPKFSHSLEIPEPI
jgi:hypothetical protein